MVCNEPGGQKPVLSLSLDLIALNQMEANPFRPFNPYKCAAFVQEVIDQIQLLYHNMQTLMKSDFIIQNVIYWL